MTTPDIAGLCERLRRRRPVGIHRYQMELINSDGPKAAYTIERQAAEIERLRGAAQALIDRWETPLWKDVPATAVFIANLKAALTGEES